MLQDKIVERAMAQPVINSINSATSVSNIDELFTKIAGFVAVIAGIIAFIYLVYSGILYLTAAGNPDAAKKGQQGVINAVIGIVIIVAAYVIINAVTGTTSDLLNSKK